MLSLIMKYFIAVLEGVKDVALQTSLSTQLVDEQRMISELFLS